MVSASDTGLPHAHTLALVGNGGVDRLLSPVHRWVWSDARRRAHKLLGFSATEADSGRDMARAAECTRDPLLRRLYLRHSMDETRHARLFSTRGHAILAGLDAGAGAKFRGDWFSPGERGLDDLDVARLSDVALLAFLYLSERAGARRFVVYGDLLCADPETRAVFAQVLRDEAFHTNYSYAQLRRIAPGRQTWHILFARLTRLWKAYLRLAAAVASVMGAVVLTVQYFVLLPLFALAAKRSGSRESAGWIASRPAGALRSQY